MNRGFFQLTGPFERNEELIDKIRETNPGFNYIKKLGVQSKMGHQLKINDKQFMIGEKDLIEFFDVNITSIFFLQDENEKTILDFILKDEDI